MTRVTRWWLPLVAAVLVAMITLVLSQARSYEWLGETHQTAASLVNSASISVLVVLVLAMLAGAIPARRRQLLLERTTLHGLYARPLLVIGSLTVAGMIGTAIAAAVMIIQTADRKPFNPVPWATFLPALTAVFLAAALGYALGTLLPWPPLALAAAPIGWTVVGYGANIDALEPILRMASPSDAYSNLSVWFSATQSILYVVAAGTLLLVVCGARGVLVGVVMAGTAAGVLISMPIDAWQHPNPRAAAVTCSTDPIGLCTTAAESGLRFQITPWLVEAVDAATVLAPGRVAFTTTNDAPPATPGTRLFTITPRVGYSVATAPRRADTIAGVLAQLMNPNNCPTTGPPSGGDTESVTSMGQVLRWRYRSLGLPTDYTVVPDGQGSEDTRDDLSHRLAAMSLTEQTKWFEAHRKEVVSCQEIP